MGSQRSQQTTVPGGSTHSQAGLGVVETQLSGPSVPPEVRTSISPGNKIGEYEVENVLGSGSFGTVYGAVQPLIGKRVAIKVLDRRYSVDPEMVSRFVAEARAVNKIGHANIVDIFSFGELEDGRRYFVMERLDGQPLVSLLGARGRLEVSESLAILAPVGRALDAAHAAGIAHRDLKPDNIFLVKAEDGGWRPKLLDFGVAKLLTESESSHATATGVTVGTPAYMAPEQCIGKGVDHRADIYAFGVLAYRMLTGHLPFEAEASSIVMAHHIYEQPRPPRELRPELGAPISDAVLWMLDKAKDGRPQSLAEAVRALEEAARGQAPPRRYTTTSRVIPASAPSGLRRPGHRRGLVAWIGGCALLAGLGLGAARLLPAARPAQPRTPLPAPAQARAPAPAPAPAPPARVRVEVRGVPEGTLVRDDRGATLGSAPGVIELERSEQSRRLVIQPRGAPPLQRDVIPSRDQALDIEAPAPARRPARKPGPARAPRPDDLEPWR